MSDQTQNPGGVLNSARRVARSLLGLLQARIELFGVELQEEKLRTASQLFWLGLAIAFALGGVLVAIGTLALYLWQIAGYPGLVGLVIATLAVAGAFIWIAYRQLQNAPKPFTSTLDEFRKDMECFRQPD
jgi:uncharacterized membrane protein YqjE